MLREDDTLDAQGKSTAIANSEESATPVYLNKQSKATARGKYSSTGQDHPKP